MAKNDIKLRMEYDPYQQKISYQYQIVGSENEEWQELADENPLINKKYQLASLQNIVDEIIEIMIEKYSYNGQFDLVFIGTEEDFLTLQDAAQQNPSAPKYINLCKDERFRYLSAAKVSAQIDEIFQKLEVEFHQAEDNQILDILKQYKDAASTTIPICVTGLYSSGKSAFINALIGEEILPSGSDPLTAKIFRVVPSTDHCISFTCNNKNLQFKITNEKATLLNHEDCSQYADLIRAITAIDGTSNAKVMHRIISFLNGKIEDCNIIHVEIPFHNSTIPLDKVNIEIYDTPGSDAISHEDHRKALENALSERTNGLPILITTKKDLDRESIETLMKELDGNVQLDRNNILVILNKADGDSNKDLESFKNSYSSAKTAITSWKNTKIFLLSSAVAIGCKKSVDTWNDEECEMVYCDSKSKFVSRDNKFYRTLPKYNILPDSRYCVIFSAAQKVQEQVESGDTSDKTCNELIAQNSGIRGIENEITHYAQRYASYNKCRTAADYLEKAIQKTKEQAECQKSRQEQIKKEQEDQFKKTYDTLLKELRNFTKNFCDKARKSDLFRSDEKRNKLTSEAHKAMDAAYEKHKKDKSADAFSNEINRILRTSLTDFREYVEKPLLSFWKSKEQEYKECLIKRINGEANISDAEKEFLSAYILQTQYKPGAPSFFNVVQDGYVKEKKLLWFKFGLNFKSKDCKEAFDQKLKMECLDTMSHIRSTFGESFENWSMHLLTEVQGKLGEFNPTLNQLSQEIEESEMALENIKSKLGRLHSAQTEIGKLMVRQYEEETV